MSTEEGMVVKVEGNKAWIKVQRSAMCEGCRSQKTCHSIIDSPDMECEALNTAGSKAGDHVLLHIKSGSLLKISFILYMIPVLALIAGAIIGIHIAQTFKMDSELSSLMFAVIGCGLSFIVVKVLANKIARTKEYLPEVLRVIHSPTVKKAP